MNNQALHHHQCKPISLDEFDRIGASHVSPTDVYALSLSGADSTRVLSRLLGLADSSNIEILRVLPFSVANLVRSFQLKDIDSGVGFLFAILGSSDATARGNAKSAILDVCIWYASFPGRFEIRSDATPWGSGLVAFKAIRNHELEIDLDSPELQIRAWPWQSQLIALAALRERISDNRCDEICARIMALAQSRLADHPDVRLAQSELSECIEFWCSG